MSIYSLAKDEGIDMILRKNATIWLNWVSERWLRPFTFIDTRDILEGTVVDVDTELQPVVKEK